MRGGGGFKVLTAGLLRVELAPEEYQLYSEGCAWGEEDRTGDQHEDIRQATATTVSCCGGDIAETLFDKHSEDLQLLNCTPRDQCHHKQRPVGTRGRQRRTQQNTRGSINLVGLA